MMTSEGVTASLSPDGLGVLPVSQHANSWVPVSRDGPAATPCHPSPRGSFLNAPFLWPRQLTKAPRHRTVELYTFRVQCISACEQLKTCC